jgi:HlyD family secretion protein
MKRLLLFALGAALCTACGCLASRLLLPPSAAADQGAGAAGTANPILEGRLITSLGRLEPEGRVIDVGVTASGMNDVLARLLVEEGDAVEADQLLGYLATYPSRLAERNHAAKLLSEAKARLQSETAYGQAILAEAQLEVEAADRLRALEIETQEAKVRVRQTESNNHRVELKRYVELRPSGAVAQQDLDYHAMVERRGAEELSAEQALLRRLKATRELELRKARAHVATAEAALTRATDAITIDSLTEALLLAEERLKLSAVRAPCAGRILSIRTRPGEAVGTKPILRMGHTAHMIAVAEVYYTDARFVKVGQRARIISPALPGPINGTISQVGCLIFKNDVLNIDPTADVDARVVEVRIRLDPDETASRLVYLQVKVEIDPNGRTAE